MLELFRNLITRPQQQKFTPATAQDEAFKLGMPKDSNTLMQADAYANLAWVQSAISLIAETAAQLPIKLYTDTMEGGQLVKKEIESGPWYDLFSQGTQHSSPVEMKTAMFASYLFSGNAYLFHDAKNKNLWNLLPQNMAVVASQEQFVLKYIYKPRTPEAKLLDPIDVVHIKSFNSLSPFYGLSKLQAAWSQVSFLDKDDRFWEIFWKEGGRLFGIFSADGALSDVQVKRLKENIRSSQGGYKNMQRSMVLDHGMKFQQIGVSQRDSQILEKSHMTVEAVLSIFRVPPGLVGLLKHSNFSNMEVQERLFWKNAILPMLRLFQETLSSHPFFSANGEIYYEFDTKEIDALKANEKQIAETGEILLRSGQWTANEVRETLWNLEDLADGNVLKPLVQEAPGGIFTRSIEDIKKKEVEQPEINEIKAPLNSPYDKDFRDIKRAEFDDKVEERDDVFLSPIVKIFKAQKEAVLKRVRENFKATGSMYVKKNEIDDLLSVLPGFEAELADALKIGHEKVMNEFGEEAAEFLESRFPSDAVDTAVWNFGDPRVQRFIRQRSVGIAGVVNDETLRMVRETISTVFEDQKGDIQNVTDAVSELFGGMERWRASRIARTETAAGANEAIDSTWNMNPDTVIGKTWITARDGDVRDSHMIDGQSVEVNESFVLGDGSLIKYPLESGAAPENVINCRCTSLPVTVFDLE